MALSLGASFSEHPDPHTDTFQIYKSSSATRGKNEKGLLPGTQVAAQATEVCEKRWEHPCGKYMAMFNPRAYLFSKLFQHMLLKSLMTSD